MMDIDLFEQGRDIFSNQYVILALTFAVFFFIKRLQRRTGWMLLNPILIAIVLIIIYLKITGVSFETYKTDAQLIDFWLKPAVVALGVPLYLQLDAIKRLWLPIVLSQLVGCLVGIVSVVTVAKLCGASDVIILSMASKSVQLLSQWRSHRASEVSLLLRLLSLSLLVLLVHWLVSRLYPWDMSTVR